MKKQTTYKYKTESIMLSRADIDSIGFDSSKLSDEEFTRIGEKAGEYVMENWWIALEELCKDLPELEDSIPLN